ncbi:hypothetical protein ACF1BU_35400 [Streptomyces sp. NPDC014724]|uniref:hypothetical protein n=1 Tax=unclassified Streptomyces TaxID=2593676 RepID=UPI0036FD9E79
MTAVSLEHASAPADTGEVTLLTARRGEPGYEAAPELWAKGTSTARPPSQATWDTVEIQMGPHAFGRRHMDVR